MPPFASHKILFHTTSFQLIEWNDMNEIYWYCVNFLPLKSPRKIIGGPTVDGASPNKVRKLSMDQSKDNETKKNEFSAIKSQATMEFDPQLEPLLRENPKRFVVFPIRYKDIWDMYKKVSFHARSIQKRYRNDDSSMWNKMC